SQVSFPGEINSRTKDLKCPKMIFAALNHAAKTAKKSKAGTPSHSAHWVHARCSSHSVKPKSNQMTCGDGIPAPCDSKHWQAGWLTVAKYSKRDSGLM